MASVAILWLITDQPLLVVSTVLINATNNPGVPRGRAARTCTPLAKRTQQAPASCTQTGVRRRAAKQACAFSPCACCTNGINAMPNGYRCHGACQQLISCAAAAPESHSSC